MTNEDLEEKKDALRRYEKIRREHLGAAINLIFGLSTAAVGFCLLRITDKDSHFTRPGAYYFVSATVIFIVTVGICLVSTWTRLRDFRLTVLRVRRELRGADNTELERLRETTKRLGKWTWNLFYSQLLSFGLGVIILTIALSLLYREHIFPKPSIPDKPVKPSTVGLTPTSPSQPNGAAQPDKSSMPPHMTAEDFAAYSMKLREHALPEVKPRKPQELTPEERTLVDAYDKAVSSYEQIRLALAYANGTGITQDYKKAIELLQQAADQGNALAQTNLASFYSEGKGVPQDYSKAAELYKKAADQGYALAEVNLGWFYSEGKGVPQDYSKAAELYKKVADQHFPTAQAYLASAYAEGKGVERDYQKAIELYQKSVASGSFPNAYNDFAWFLATCPEASQRNGQKAVEYATTACVMTQWKVRNFVGTLAAAYAELGDFDKAIKYQKDASALQGDYPSEAEMKRDLALYVKRKPFRTNVGR